MIPESRSPSGRPTTYDTYIYERGRRNRDVTDARRYRCYSGGPGVYPAANQLVAIDAASGTGLLHNARTLLITAKGVGYNPSQSLLTHLFASAGRGGAAIFPPYFWMRAPNQRPISC